MFSKLLCYHAQNPENRPRLAFHSVEEGFSCLGLACDFVDRHFPKCHGTNAAVNRLVLLGGSLRTGKSLRVAIENRPHLFGIGYASSVAGNHRGNILDSEFGGRQKSANTANLHELTLLFENIPT